MIEESHAISTAVTQATPGSQAAVQRQVAQTPAPAAFGFGPPNTAPHTPACDPRPPHQGPLANHPTPHPAAQLPGAHVRRGGPRLNRQAAGCVGRYAQEAGPGPRAVNFQTKK